MKSSDFGHLILHHFASIWLIGFFFFFGWCEAAAVDFNMGVSICTAPKLKVVSEAVTSDDTALGWSARCCALNGSPADKIN